MSLEMRTDPASSTTGADLLLGSDEPAAATALPWLAAVGLDPSSGLVR